MKSVKTLGLALTLMVLSSCVTLQYQPTVQTVSVDQGWTDGVKQKYRHLSQGTALIPYKWFMALEQPTFSLTETPKFHRSDYLVQFGFIPSRQDPTYNPDGLPIGFTKDHKYINFDTGNRETVVGLTCAACHTGQINFKQNDEVRAVVIDGAPSNIDLGLFKKQLGMALYLTDNLPFRFSRFAKDVDDPEGEEALKAKLHDLVETGIAILEKRKPLEKHKVATGFGRLDALASGGNRVFGNINIKNRVVSSAPINFPQLWDIWKFNWVQWNASIRQPMGRNIAEALGVKAGLKISSLSEKDQNLKIQSTVRIKNIHWLESTLQGLSSPKWDPAIMGKLDPQKVEQGENLYKKHCKSCHEPKVIPRTDQPCFNEYKSRFPNKPFEEYKLTVKPIDDIGTDPNQATNFNNRTVILPDNIKKFIGLEGVEKVTAAQALQALTEKVIVQKYDELGLSSDERQIFNNCRTNRFRSKVEGELKYRARPLNGIWATGPFLHNGSVPNLYQLLSPMSERADRFYTGNRLFDSKHVGYSTKWISGAFEYFVSGNGNKNTGHLFTNQLDAKGRIDPEFTPAQRFAIIEYLKTL